MNAIDAMEHDLGVARKISHHMRGALEVAFDAVLDAGWTIDRIRVAHSMAQGACVQLQLHTERDYWHTVFEVMLTFDVALPLHVREMPNVVNIIERWVTSIPTAPHVDLDAVDEEALAKMFPDWKEIPGGRRRTKARGVIG